MFDRDMDEAVDSAAAADAHDPSIFVASNGLRLRLRKVPRMLIIDASKRLKPPTVPKTWDDDKQREIENPADPEYRAAVTEFQLQMGLLTMNVYFTLGTSVIEPVPADIIPLDSSEWVEMVRMLFPEADIPDTGPRRRLAWMKYHAMPDEDHIGLLSALARLGGQVAEEDATKAQESFRPDTSRSTTEGVVIDVESRHGPVDQPDNAGSGSGAGTEGSNGIRALPPTVMGNSPFVF